MNIFKPTWMIETIYDLSPKDLKQHHISAILTDLDNTLMPWNVLDGSPQLKKWVDDLHQAGIKIIVVSNNNEERIERAVKGLGIDIISRALKPTKIGINRAIKTYHLKKANTIMMGDQLLTDILVANRVKIRSILVKPIVKSDGKATFINRKLEIIVKHHLSKKYPNLTWKKELD